MQVLIDNSVVAGTCTLEKLSRHNSMYVCCHPNVDMMCNNFTSHCCKAPIEPLVVYLPHHGFLATMPEPQLIWIVVGVQCLSPPLVLQVEHSVLDSADLYNVVVGDRHTRYVDTWLHGA